MRQGGLRLIGGVLALACWASAEGKQPAPAAAPATAQPTRFARIEMPGDPQLILAEQLRRLQDLDALQKILADPSKLDIEALKRMLQNLDTTNPGVTPKLEEMKKLLDGVPDQKHPPLKELRAAVAKTLERAKEPQPSTGPIMEPEPSARDAMSAAPPPAPNLDERVLRWLHERMLDPESRLGEFFRDSPAFREILEDLQNMLGETPGQLGNWADGLTADLPGFLGSLDPSSLPLPELPSLSLGEVSVPGLPGFGGGSLPSPGFFSIVEGVLWLVLGVGAALALWYVWKRGQAKRAAGSAGWQIGPWPVDPSRVATAAELIQAFDYLALRRSGLEARWWHHRAVADTLAVPQHTAQQQAASELADLYEQARYAPDVELSPAAMAAARRDLCLLAGATP